METSEGQQFDQLPWSEWTTERYQVGAFEDTALVRSTTLADGRNIKERKFPKVAVGSVYTDEKRDIIETYPNGVTRRWIESADESLEIESVRIPSENGYIEIESHEELGTYQVVVKNNGSRIRMLYDTDGKFIHLTPPEDTSLSPEKALVEELPSFDAKVQYLANLLHDINDADPQKAIDTKTFNLSILEEYCQMHDFYIEELEDEALEVLEQLPDVEDAEGKSILALLILFGLQYRFAFAMQQLPSMDEEGLLQAFIETTIPHVQGWEDDLSEQNKLQTIWIDDASIRIGAFDIVSRVLLQINPRAIPIQAASYDFSQDVEIAASGEILHIFREGDRVVLTNTKERGAKKEQKWRVVLPLTLDITQIKPLLTTFGGDFSLLGGYIPILFEAT